MGNNKSFLKHSSSYSSLHSVSSSYLAINNFSKADPSPVKLEDIAAENMAQFEEEQKELVEKRSLENAKEIEIETILTKWTELVKENKEEQELKQEILLYEKGVPTSLIIKGEPKMEIITLFDIFGPCNNLEDKKNYERCLLKFLSIISYSTFIFLFSKVPKLMDCENKEEEEEVGLFFLYFLPQLINKQEKNLLDILKEQKKDFWSTNFLLIPSLFANACFHDLPEVSLSLYQLFKEGFICSLNKKEEEKEESKSPVNKVLSLMNILDEAEAYEKNKETKEKESNFIHYFISLIRSGLFKYILPNEREYEKLIILIMQDLIEFMKRRPISYAYQLRKMYNKEMLVKNHLTFFDQEVVSFLLRFKLSDPKLEEELIKSFLEHYFVLEKEEYFEDKNNSINNIQCWSPENILLLVHKFEKENILNYLLSKNNLFEQDTLLELYKKSSLPLKKVFHPLFNFPDAEYLLDKYGNQGTASIMGTLTSLLK